MYLGKMNKDYGDIEVSADEMDHLRTVIKNVYRERNPQVQLKTNSNVINYKQLTDDIKEKTGDENITNRFLLSFFYESLNKKKATFRKRNINILQEYTLMTNELTQTSISKEKYFVYYDWELEDIDKTIEEPYFKGKEIVKKYTINSLLSKDIEDIVKESNQNHIILIMNQSILKNAFLELYNLLGLKNINSLIDVNNLHFFINSDLQDIKTNIGRIRIAEKILENKELEDEINVELGDRGYENVEDVLKYLLFVISEILKNQWFELKGEEFDTTKHLTKMLKQISNESVYDLTDIIKNGKENNNSTYLCVIGFADYFNIDEKYEMISYFSKFNNTMLKNNSKVYRIFTLPAIRVKSKGWKLNMSDEEKQLAFQYMYTNYKYGGRTLVMLYDENRVDWPDIILRHQDYVIRFGEKFWMDEEKSIEEFVINTDKKIRLKKEKVLADANIYLAFEQDEFGANQMIQFDGEKYPFYILRFFRDFKNRLRFLINNNMKLNNVKEDYALFQLDSNFFENITEDKITNNDRFNALDMNKYSSDIFKLLKEDVSFILEI